VPDIATTARAFGERPGISARSVLVTIFGDSVVPLGGEIWLTDLIGLCEPFGFNERLVRTSLFRLAADDWFDTERVGRRSRYRLSAAATDAFAAAERRIYHRPRDDWDGTWTLALLDGVAKPARDRVERDLRALGYVTLGGGVLATPRPDDGARIGAAARHAGAGGPVPVAAARFADLDQLVASGWPVDGFGLEAVGDRYRAVLDRYRVFAEETLAPGDDEAFVLRTMVVHDLRRARLGDPDLPAALLPADWPLDAALDLCGSLYRRLSPGTWRWLRARPGLAGPCRRLRRFD
jgi:phenylacetic acid degradation operon negative regulatory protein